MTLSHLLLYLRLMSLSRTVVFCPVFMQAAWRFADLFDFVLDVGLPVLYAVVQGEWRSLMLLATYQQPQVLEARKASIRRLRLVDF